MNIGLIAHDAKKILMQNFCIAYRGILSKHTIFATGTTGRLVEDDDQCEKWTDNQTDWRTRMMQTFLAGH